MLYCGVCIDLLPIVAIPELEAFILSPTTQENFPDYAKLTVACFESVILEVNTKWKFVNPGVIVRSFKQFLWSGFLYSE